MSLEEIIARLEEYKEALWPRKKLLLLAIVLGFAGGITYAIFQPINYTATTTFHPETGGKAMITMDNPLAALFGDASGDKDAMQMIGVLSSRTLSEMVAADSVDMGSGKRLIADWVLEVYPSGFNFFRWVKKLFSESKGPPTLDSKIIGAGSRLRGKMEVKVNEKGFIEMTVSLENSALAGTISFLYIDNLKEYYKAQKTEKAKNNLGFFTREADSVRMELDASKLALARFYDESKYRIRARDELYAQEKEAEVRFYGEMYAKMLLNRMQAEAQLQQDIPIIQVLDHPLPPFKISRKSWIVSGFASALLLLLILSAVFVRDYLKRDVFLMVSSLFETNGEEKKKS